MQLDHDHDENCDQCQCPLCGGPIGLMGTLGTVEHFQCRDCGAEFSQDRRPSK